MKWKCEVKHRGKRYELVECSDLFIRCSGCAFCARDSRCNLPFGFPSCSVERAMCHNSDGNWVFEHESRVWKVVEK